MTEEKILDSMKELAKKEGIILTPEVAAMISDIKHLEQEKEIIKEKNVILFGRGNQLITTKIWN